MTVRRGPRHYRRLIRALRDEARAIHVDSQASRANTEQLLADVAELTRRLASYDERLREIAAQVAQSEGHRTADHQRTLLALRMIRDDDARAWNRLWELRSDPEYELAFTDPEPLVTVVITTYSNWRLMRDRAIPSVLAQTYENWECLVVGDAAPPEAAEVVASFGDPRLRFVNLSYRGPYPPNRQDAWFVSATTPWNTALKLARGRWIGTVSDDDALTPDYVRSLLALARDRRAELAYGQLRFRFPDRPDKVVGSPPPPTFGTWGTQCSLVHAGLGFIPMFHSDWVFGTPNDWSWAERLMRIGVRMAMLEEVMVDYFPSTVWTDRPPIE